MGGRVYEPTRIEPSGRQLRADGGLQTEEDWFVTETIIEEGASLGSGSTLCAGVRIGARAIIGAGSVVTKSVPSGEIWGGNPAKFFRKIN